MLGRSATWMRSGPRSGVPGVRFHTRPTTTLASATMPGTEWFVGATLNYAEHALTDDSGRGDDDLAVVLVREDGLERFRPGELRDFVGRVRIGLLRLGVGRGDRVVALLPNCPEALAAFLAVASLGATWSSCSPDLGHVRCATGSPSWTVSVPRSRRLPLRRKRVRRPGARAGIASTATKPDCNGAGALPRRCRTAA